MSIWGFTIFCDDIRHEIGGKKSYIGCYFNELIIDGSLPVTLPKLSFVVNIVLPFLNSSKGELLVYLPTDADEPTIRSELPRVTDEDRAQFGQAFDRTDADRELRVMAEFVMAPFEVPKAGAIRVVALVEGEEIPCGRLDIRSAADA